MRECGECTLCCKVVSVPEISKPTDTWCQHCTSKGCLIYERRPKGCKDYECLWLRGLGSEEVRPDKVHFYLAGHEDNEVLEVRVDTDYPEAWKGHEYIEDLLCRRHLLVAVGRQLTFLACKTGPVPEKIMVDWTL